MMLPWITSHWLWCLSLFFVALITIALLSTITLDCYARRRKDDDYLVIKVNGVYGLMNFTLKLSEFNLTLKGIFVKREKKWKKLGLKSKDQTTNEWNVNTEIQKYEQWTEALSLVKDLKGWIRKVLNSVQLTEWKWYSYVGTGDAMTAAMTCGLFWSVKGIIFGTLSQFVKVKEKPDVKIEPVYEVAYFATEWSCIAKMKLWQVVLAGLYLIFSLTSLKRGIKLWRNVTAQSN